MRRLVKLIELVGILSGADCMTGQCSEVDGGPVGMCTEACRRYCPDLDASYATTFCVEESTTGSGMWTVRCNSNDDCPMGTSCEESPRFSQASVVRSAYVPY